jgi:hypothetical protein
VRAKTLVPQFPAHQNRAPEKAVKQLVRAASKGLTVLAGVVFLFAPFRGVGWTLKLESIVVGTIGVAGWLISEPNEDPTASDDPANRLP